MKINLDHLFTEGQERMETSIKTLLYRSNPMVFDLIDFEHDSAFMEPLLSSFVISSNSDLSLEQILFGHQLKTSAPMTFNVVSNYQGYIILPNYGYLKTPHPTTTFTLSVGKSSLIQLTSNNQPVEYEFLPIRFVPDYPTIELTDIIDPFSEQFFLNWRNRSTEEMETFISESHLELDQYAPALTEALNLLRDHFPDEFNRYVLGVRRIVLFSNHRLRNFVTRETHGIIYLNVNQDTTAAFFLEELIHQCSHVVFNAASFDIKALFNVNPFDYVGVYSGDELDHRTLYGALHGIFTTGEIVNILTRLLKKDVELPRELRYELIGRLALNKNRHDIGLEKVDSKTVFTPAGKELFLFFYHRLDHDLSAHPEFFIYDIEEHPIVFSYWKFEHDNPIDQYLPEQ